MRQVARRMLQAVMPAALVLSSAACDSPSCDSAQPLVRKHLGAGQRIKNGQGYLHRSLEAEQHPLLRPGQR